MQPEILHFNQTLMWCGGCWSTHVRWSLHTLKTLSFFPHLCGALTACLAGITRHLGKSLFRRLVHFQKTVTRVQQQCQVVIIQRWIRHSPRAHGTHPPQPHKKTDRCMKSDIRGSSGRGAEGAMGAWQYGAHSRLGSWKPLKTDDAY